MSTPAAAYEVNAAPRRTPADVAAELHVVEWTPLDASVGGRRASGEVGADTGHGEHPAAGDAAVGVDTGGEQERRRARWWRRSPTRSSRSRQVIGAPVTGRSDSRGRRRRRCTAACERTITGSWSSDPLWWRQGELGQVGLQRAGARPGSPGRRSGSCTRSGVGRRRSASARRRSRRRTAYRRRRSSRGSAGRTSASRSSAS